MPTLRHFVCESFRARTLPAWLALIALILAYVLAPYFYAGTHPLIVRADLEESSTLVAELADGWSAALVRTEDGSYATELPPRKSYTLSLNLAEGEGHVSQIRILDLHQRPISDLLVWDAAGSTSTLSAEMPMQVCRNLASTQKAFLRTLSTLFCLFWLLGYGLLAMMRTLTPPSPANGRGAGGLWLWFATLVGLHLWLVMTATPLFWWADSVGYAGKAMAFFQHGTYDTGQIFGELSRAPGAPLIEALAWKLFGFSVASVALLQALLYCAVACFALGTISRASNRMAAALVALPVLLSPPAMMGNRLFASEAPFLIFALLSTTCILWAFKTSGRKQWLWVGGATLAAVMTTLARPNGVILLSFPLFMLGRAGITLLRERKAAPLKHASVWLLPVLTLGCTLLLWSWRNNRAVGYFTPTDIVGLSSAEATFKSGVLDLKTGTGDDDALYERVVLARYKSQYNFEAWSLSSIFQERIKAEGELKFGDSARADAMLGDFAKRSNRNMDGRIMFARFLRELNWGLFMERDANFQPYGRPDLHFVVYDDASWAYTNSVISGWVHPDLVITQKPLGMAQRWFNAALWPYLPCFVLTIVAGLMAFAFSARSGRLASLVFLLPYFGNILFNAYLGVVISRYILVLEPFLWLGLALAAPTCYRVFSKRPISQQDTAQEAFRG